MTAIAYATKHLSIVKLFPETDPSIQQQAFVYAAANGSLDAVAFLLDDNRYSSVDINQVDSVHGETGLFSIRTRTIYSRLNNDFSNFHFSKQ